MMRVKFNKYERTAGFFVLFAFIGMLASLIGIAVKQGWFEKKVHYTAQFKNADGVHPGTQVEIFGINAGAVEGIDLLTNNNIQIQFYILDRYSAKIKKDSMAQFVRPFIIGERVLELTVGSEDSPVLASGAEILTSETTDLMTILSGRNLGSYIGAMSETSENLKVFAQALFDKKRTKSFIKVLDQMEPLIKNVNRMTVEMTKLSQQTTSSHFPQDVNRLVGNMNELTEQFKVVLPALAAVAPELPATSKRAVEALNETVILIKALQKSFFVKGSVEEVRQEEAKQKREPANSQP